MKDIKPSGGLSESDNKPNYKPLTLEMLREGLKAMYSTPKRECCGEYDEMGNCKGDGVCKNYTPFIRKSTT